MTTNPGGYLPPDDEDDDQIAAQVLEDLRDRLDAASEYGSIPWRTERDAQMHRLAADHGLTAHITRSDPSAALTTP